MDEGREITEGSLEIITRAETDSAIATAKMYPRDVKAVQEECLALVTMNEKVASDCIYAVPRAGKTIEGASARFAEALISSWGNMVAGARVIGEDGDFIVAQGMSHDLQKNVKIMYEVKRKIVDKQGRKFNADLIQVTANAACSIALRNTALKVIPKAFWEPMYDAAKQKVIGDATNFPNLIADALGYLQKFGATEEMVLTLLKVESKDDITEDHIVTLRGLATAIKDGDTTVAQAFGPDVQEKEGGAASVVEKVKSGKKTKEKKKDGDDY